MESKIYYLDRQTLNDRSILDEHIYKNLELNYYWSDDFSPEFYIELANAGFITVGMKDNGRFLLLPEIQFEYALLDFDDLHISKKVKKLLKKDDCIFSINKHFDKTMTCINSYHEDSWLYDEYIQLLQKLKNFNHPKIDFELLSVELSDKDTKELIASEIGYRIGKTYTSLTGFFNRDKKYNNYGKLQLVLLAEFLKQNNFDFWNLGHPYMQYKFDMGAKNYSRSYFLKKWLKSIN